MLTRIIRLRVVMSSRKPGTMHYRRMRSYARGLRNAVKDRYVYVVVLAIPSYAALHNSRSPIGKSSLRYRYPPCRCENPVAATCAIKAMQP